MNKVLQYLNRHAQSVQNSQTTNSIYYKIDGMLIRYSDHITSRQKEDINICVSKNYAKQYVVLGTNSTFYLFNAKETINFIKQSALYINLCKIETKIKTPVVETPSPAVPEPSILKFETYEEFNKWSQEKMGKLFTKKLFVFICKYSSFTEVSLQKFLIYVQTGMSKHTALQLAVAE